jgi:hypothetical protein
MKKESSPDELEDLAFEVVDDYLKRNVSENICFYNMKEHHHSPAGGYAKRLLLDNRLVTLRAGDNSITDVTEQGLSVLKIGGIRKFLDVKDAGRSIRQENERLQNSLLKEQEKNRILEKDLKDAQYQLTVKQTNDLRKKNRDEIIKIVVTGVITFILGYLAKKIYG